MEDYEDHENYDAYLDKFEYRDQHLDLLKFYISTLTKQRKALKKNISLYYRCNYTDDLKVYHGIKKALSHILDDTEYSYYDEINEFTYDCWSCLRRYFYEERRDSYDASYWVREAFYDGDIRELTRRKLGKLLSRLGKTVKPLIEQQKADLELYFGHNNSRV